MCRPVTPLLSLYDGQRKIIFTILFIPVSIGLCFYKILLVTWSGRRAGTDSRLQPYHFSNVFRFLFPCPPFWILRGVTAVHSFLVPGSPFIISRFPVLVTSQMKLYIRVWRVRKSAKSPNLFQDFFSMIVAIYLNSSPPSLQVYYIWALYLSWLVLCERIDEQQPFEQLNTIFPNGWHQPLEPLQFLSNG